MYLPMERSKHSIIVSELTLLGTKNRKQTKVFFFYVQAGGVNKTFRNLQRTYTVCHPVQLKQPYAECGCILCFFISVWFICYSFIYNLCFLLMSETYCTSGCVDWLGTFAIAAVLI